MNPESFDIHDYRYERKFSIAEISRHEVESIVRFHPAMFSEIYQRRFVNNLYFDSLQMKHYFDNIDGASCRMKVRIRWYGDLFGAVEKPVLEFKIKTGALGKKESSQLSQFWINEKDFPYDTVVNAVKESDIPNTLKSDFISLKPSLLNRYSRKYYQSADGNYRVTIDSEMTFYQVNTHHRAFSNKSVDMVSIVLELKYDHDKDHLADYVSSYFPFRLTKSSKYVAGVERLYV